MGRAAELAAVARVIGSCGAVVVRGDAGVGKSALLEAALAGAQGVRVLRASGELFPQYPPGFCAAILSIANE